MPSHHGCTHFRGARQDKPLPSETRRFGRLFGELGASHVPADLLVQLGALNGPMDEGVGPSPGEARMPAGFVFFGQFIDHDITLDVTSSLDAAKDPDATENFRTPALDLDCVYGAGREASPYLYSPDDNAKLLIGNPPEGNDLPRNVKPDGTPGVALIGDPRNDENRILSQLQLGFFKFHNAVVDIVRAEPEYAHASDGEVFEQARERVRWHYQWVVIHDFLPRICGTARVSRIMGGRLKTGFTERARNTPFIPVEFSVAAYRFGHSQVPGILSTNNPAQTFELFGSEVGEGFEPVNDADDIVDWSLFFNVGGQPPQKARRLDTKLASTLCALPAAVVGDDASTPRASLAVRNLLRGQTFGLPSGQAVAQAMGLTPLGEAELWPSEVPEALARELRNRAPLWYYILREARVQRNGEKLGIVGAHIVAEVIIGLIRSDPTSFLGQNPNWEPTLPRHNSRPVGQFDMVDIVALASGV